jgi:hypothetical protein
MGLKGFWLCHVQKGYRLTKQEQRHNSRPPQEYDQAVDAYVYRAGHEDESSDLADVDGGGSSGVMESL